MTTARTTVQRVTLEREAGRSNELQIDQVTVENLRRLFQVSHGCACIIIILHDIYAAAGESFGGLAAG